MSYMKADGMEVYCIMVRKGWVTPKAMVEEFEANEYVAACWGVACEVEWANLFELSQGDYNKGVTHDNIHCGNASNQVIYDDNNDGKADRMVEEGTDGLGNLLCTIYSDDNYSSVRDVSSVKVGQEIYWTTTAADGRTWNHKGTVVASTPGHPNHS